MRLVSIASGSSGNCIYVGSEHSHILVDAGISNKRIEQGLNEIGLKGSELDGVVITHEHSDHIKGLGVLARKHHVPIYGTRGTLEEKYRTKSLGKLDESLFHVIRPGESFKINNIDIHPFSIPHDARDPVSYQIESADTRIGTVTDLGYFDDSIVNELQDCDLLYVEANYDLHMLQAGPYPYQLKRRIAGNYGHLCNEMSGQLIGRLLNERLQKVILGHLSKENNYPQLAWETVRLEVTMGENPYKGSDFPMVVAKRDEVSELVTI